MGQPMIAVTITPEELEVLIQWTDRSAQQAANMARIASSRTHADHATRAQALRARAEELAKLRETAGG